MGKENVIFIVLHIGNQGKKRFNGLTKAMKEVDHKTNPYCKCTVASCIRFTAFLSIWQVNPSPSEQAKVDNNILITTSAYYQAYRASLYT